MIGAGDPWVRVGAGAPVRNGAGRLLLVQDRGESGVGWWLPADGQAFGEHPAIGNEAGGSTDSGSWVDQAGASTLPLSLGARHWGHPTSPDGT